MITHNELVARLCVDPMARYYYLVGPLTRNEQLILGGYATLDEATAAQVVHGTAGSEIVECHYDDMHPDFPSPPFSGIVKRTVRP
jgi:hypothetical protein